MRCYFEGLVWRRTHNLLYGLGTIQKRKTFPLPTIPCLTNYAILDRHAKVILTLSKPSIVNTITYLAQESILKPTLQNVDYTSTTASLPSQGLHISLQNGFLLPQLGLG